MSFSNEQVELIFQLAEQITGTSQQGSYRKEILLSNVQRRMNIVGIDDLFAYLSFVKNHIEEREWLISALTIHTTSWFRESPHFDIIEKYIKDRLHLKKKFKLWSAACSTGEEVYTLGLVCAKIKDLHPEFEFEIYGSDIDPKSVRFAEIGHYNATALKSIPSKYHNHLLITDDSESALIKVDENIRKHCYFSVGNLAEFKSKENQVYDIVICRNVLIYFKPDQVDQIVANSLVKKLTTDGLLVLGHSEILSSNFKDTLNLLNRSCYKKSAAVKSVNLPDINQPMVKPVSSSGKSFQPKILVVDDSITIRNSLRILLTKKNCQVTTVASAAEATEVLQYAKFDLVTLDLNMPGENGLSWLKRQRASGFTVPVVIISDSSPQEAMTIFGALENGAQDYIVKKDITQNPEKLFELLDTIASRTSVTSKLEFNLKPFELSQFAPEVILIGASTGGPQALAQLLENWPKPTPPVIVVQHMTVEFSQSFAQRLASVAQLSLAKIDDTAIDLQPNTLYMSVGDYHLELIHQNRSIKVRKNFEEKKSGHRPSVSKLFLSAAQVKMPCMSIMLTGMGNDGADGVNALGLTEKCYNLAQDEKTSIVFGMPRKAIETNQVSYVGSVDQIKSEVFKVLTKKLASAS